MGDLGTNGVRYREGMLVFQTLPKAGIGRVIADATDSDILHVGILHKKNETGQWVVIESIGQPGYQPPVNEFLRRSQGVAWYKMANGLNAGNIRRFIQRAEELSKRPYDLDYKYGNDEMYCSELVALAAQHAGINLFDVDIPSAWLDRSEQSVRKYLSDYHRIAPGGAIPVSWRILPPHTLFYSNKLRDPEGVSHSANTPNGQVPNNAIYDTLPGKTVEEKFQYLKEAWSNFSNKVEIRKDPIRDSYEFVLSIDGVQYSLILFGHFKEEGELIGRIRGYISNSGQ